MDKTQFHAIAALLTDAAIGDADKVTNINEILGIDISDEAQARAFKEKVIGLDTITIAKEDGKVTVSFADTATTGPNFGVAFIATLMNVLNDRAIDKFLPEPVVEKTKSGGKRDGLGSPAAQRSLPVHNGNY